MLIDRWDVSHICIAVDDVESAMARYTSAMGVEWSTPHTWERDGVMLGGKRVEMATVSPVHGAGVSMEGLSGVWGVSGGKGPDGLPVAVLELASAREASPAAKIWGCGAGQEYVHHIGYWVDDTEAESRQLMENGFALELTTPPGDVARGFGYLLSPGGLRIELMEYARKAEIWDFQIAGRLGSDMGVLQADA